MTASRDPLRFFRQEAREISGELGRTVLALEKEPAPGQVARLLRLAHTLKGAAAVMRQRAIAAEAHALEDALVPLRGREGAAAPDDIERILAHADAIAAQVAALETPEAARGADEQGLAVTDVGMLPDMLTEAGVLIRGVRHDVALVREARALGAQLEDAAAGGAAPLCAALQGLLGRLEQRLGDGLEQAEREVVQAHAAAERLRLSSCAALLAPLERAVRDAAAAQGKEAAFTGHGGDIRLEMKVLAQMQRALLQLARNAVAHGIETGDERQRAGKPRQGRVAIMVARQGSRVAFTCRDDGRGIDLAAVRRAARDSGRMGDESPDDLVALLFRGGVSTSGAVTEISGRGVGLDIVREVAERLGGEVSARTTPGQGTEITLLVPASLSAMEALLVEAGGTVCALPLEAVRGTRRVTPDEVVRTLEGEHLARDGETIPFAPLWRVLRRAAPPSGCATLAVLAEQDGAVAAIGVERLLGVSNIVVRPLPESACADAVIAGASPDAEGVPRLVLEPRALLAAARGLGGEDRPAAPPPPPILVIDDSLTTRVLEQSILESAGYAVDLATSAEEGLAKARQRRYGLILVDVEMPGMDGYGFIRTIRADPELAAIPAILVTSLNAPEDRQRGMEAGAQAYVVKSEFNQVRVLETIRQCLERA